MVPFNPERVLDPIERELRNFLAGRSADELIHKFASKSRQDYDSILEGRGLKERQIAAAYGRKDELFVELLATEVIRTHGTPNWSVSKITNARDPRMGLRQVQGKSMYFGGDGVVFRDGIPKLIVQCKEYLDTIRIKELVGESVMLKQPLTALPHTTPPPLFVVFANVWELTEEWRTAVEHFGLRGHVDDFFVVRPGKRRNTDAKPLIDELNRFRSLLETLISEN